MAEYYLISQLPSLDGLGENMPLPITEQRFLQLCHQFLTKSTWEELNKLTLIPSRKHEKSSCRLMEAWNEGERKFRLILGKIRADKMNKAFDIESDSMSVSLVQVARTAVEMESPMEAEKFLTRYRLDFLETLRPMDTFSENFLFYYWLKLQLLARIRQFDAENGVSAYKNIYNSIMNGDKLEAVQ